jgi:hypothetical protein
MAKYHINPATGRANICKASVKPCPISGPAEHYTSKEAAQAAQEQKLTEDFGAVGAPASVKTAAPLSAAGKANELIYEYSLLDTYGTPEADEARIRSVASRSNIPEDNFLHHVRMKRHAEATRRQEADKSFQRRVADVADKVEYPIRKGTLLPVKLDGVQRIIEVTNIRRGRFYGPTRDADSGYEPIYLDDGVAEQEIVASPRAEARDVLADLRMMQNNSESYHRGEWDRMVPRTQAAIDGLLAFNPSAPTAEDARKLSEYLTFVSNNGDNFSAGELQRELQDAAEELKRLSA